MADSPFVSLAAQAAQANNIPVPIFDALIQKESSWNPTAQASGSTAYGLTQLTQAAQQDVGVTNINDPNQQLFGGAEYLAKQYQTFGNWNDALAAYNQGPANFNNAAGQQYAKDIFSTLSFADKLKYLTSGNSQSFVDNRANDPNTKTDFLSNSSIVKSLTDWISSHATNFSVIFMGGAIILVALLFSKAPQKIIVDTLKAAK